MSACANLPDTFKDFVEQGLLPTVRAQNCSKKVSAGRESLPQDALERYRSRADGEGAAPSMAAAARRSVVIRAAADC